MKYEFTTEARADSFWKALDQVARERRYLMFLEAPEIGRTREFIKTIIAKNWTQFFAIEDDQVVGWCDIIPSEREGARHVGHLGIGVTAGFRGQGVGQHLLKLALKDGFSKGLSRIGLDVYASNIPGIRLYEKCGFQVEGRKRRARFIDNQYDDILVMGLLKPEAEQLNALDSAGRRNRHA